jgi:PAS domain S-box-containing protein
MSPTFLNEAFVGVAALVRDVTAKKKADEALRESEGKYRLLAENVMDVIWAVDLDRRFTYVSPSVVYLLGYSVDEALSMKMDDLATPSSLDLTLSVVAEEFALWQKNPELWPRSRVVEVELVRQDGSIVWVEVRASFVFNTEDEVVGISGIARDVTERRKVQEALRESEGRYRSFMKNFQGIAFRGDRDFKPFFMHGAVEAVTGYSEEEFLGGKVRWDRLVHPDDALRYSQNSQNFNTGIVVSDQREYRIIRKDCEVRWVRELIQDFGEDDLFQGVIYDITENKRAEAELSEYRENMIQADRLASLGTMGATIAHQLNQPLTVIRLFLQQSLRALPKECCGRVRENLNDSLVEVSNAIGIINRYLTFSRRRSEEPIGKINLRTIAEKIATVLNESARKANVELRVEDLDRLPEVEGYVSDIEQIFFTLIQNAIQAADGNNKSRLVIRGEAVGGQVELIFEDTCSGIDPKDLGKIFEPFFTTKPLGLGTGLGLCILQRMVSKHGGKVVVESELGKGTTFRITLPVRF